MLRLILMLGTDTTDMEDTGDTMVDLPYGYRYYGKRSADAEPAAEAAANPEAEADPWYGYYGYGYYGKRAADAEPTADASADASPEADPWYGYYGYGYRPYGYGYYGYRPYGYAYWG